MAKGKEVKCKNYKICGNIITRLIISRGKPKCFNCKKNDVTKYNKARWNKIRKGTWSPTLKHA